MLFLGIVHDAAQRIQYKGALKMRNKTLWLTRTALMIALLVGVQFITKTLGQFVTGSCVNLILAVSALSCGYWCGFAVALLSPFFAFFLGIGPALIQIVPAVSLGNIAFVSVIGLLYHKNADAAGGAEKLGQYLSAAAAAAVKFAVLYVVVVKLMLPALGLPEKQAAVMSLMFSWPQLVTALAGGFISVTAAPIINKAVQKK